MYSSGSESHSVVSDSLQPHRLYSNGILQARILEWIAFSFSSRSSPPRDWNQVSSIAGAFFTGWATREARFFTYAAAAAKLLQLCSILCDLTGWEPTSLSHPWDSPDKNTRVGCHFFLKCMKVKSEKEVTQSCLTLQPHRHQPTRFLCPWDFPGKSIGHYRMLLISLQYMVDLHDCLFVCLFSKNIFLLLLLLLLLFLIYIFRSEAARSYGQSLVFYKRHFVVTFIMAPTEYISLVP